jgi:hypothetical protein
VKIPEIIENQQRSAHAQRGMFLLFVFAGLIIASSSFAQNSFSVTLAWDPSPDPTVVGYNLFYGNYNGIYSQSINAGGATSATVTNIFPGITYFFVVTAYNSAGVQSDPSNQVMFRYGAGAPGSPGSVINATAFLSYSGDFNGDGKQDILWRNLQTGEVDIWYMNGSTVISKDRIANVSLDWTIAGIGDFTGSGMSDILWENTVDGTFVIWVMQGDSHVDYLFPSQGDQWSITGIADLDHSGRASILWRNIVTGDLIVWQSSGSLNFSGTRIGTATMDWNLIGTADFFGDGHPVLVWRSLSTGEVVAWRVSGGVITDQASLGTVSADWNVAGFGDFKGHGHQGILWRNALDGSVAAWQMHGFQSSAEWIHQGPLSQDWQIRATPSVNGNGVNSILWSNMTTGEQLLWESNGTNFSSPGVFDQVPSGWVTQP